MSRMHNPAHPGEVLREWISEEMTVTDAAKALQVSRVTLSNVLNAKAGVTGEKVCQRLTSQKAQKAAYLLDLVPEPESKNKLYTLLILDMQDVIFMRYCKSYCILDRLLRLISLTDYIRPSYRPSRRLLAARQASRRATAVAA